MHNTTSPAVDSLQREWARRLSRHHISWTDPVLQGNDPRELQRLIGDHNRDVYAPIVTALATAAGNGDRDAATLLTLGIIDLVRNRSRIRNTSYFDDLLAPLWEAAVSCVTPTSRYARETIARNARHGYLASRRIETTTGAGHADQLDQPPLPAYRPTPTSVEDQVLTASQLTQLLDHLASTGQITDDTRRLLTAAAAGSLPRLANGTDRQRRRRTLNTARTAATRAALVA